MSDTEGKNGTAVQPAPNRLRLFVALPLPQTGAEPVLAAQAALKRRAQRSQLKPRWTVPEQLHVTLKFLGYVSPELVPELQTSLELEAESSQPIATSWAGLGAFASPARARVVVARLSDARAELMALYSRLEASLESLGFPMEERPFTPHVTLARIKTPGDVRSWLAAVSVPEAQFALTTLRLYRSTLRPNGAEYEVIAETTLGAS